MLPSGGLLEREPEEQAARKLGKQILLECCQDNLDIDSVVGGCWLSVRLGVMSAATFNTRLKQTIKQSNLHLYRFSRINVVEQV